MSDAKARHFKPHGRFPFVTSIWWRLNNSAREQAQGAQPPHHGSCASRRNTITCIIHRNTTTTTRRILLPSVSLSFRYADQTRANLSLSLIREFPTSNPPTLLSTTFLTRQDLIRVAQSDLSNHPYSSLQRSSNPLLAFLSPPTSPTPTVPRDLDNTALASGCR